MEMTERERERERGGRELGKGRQTERSLLSILPASPFLYSSLPPLSLTGDRRDRRLPLWITSPFLSLIFTAFFI